MDPSSPLKLIAHLPAFACGLCAVVIGHALMGGAGAQSMDERVVVSVDADGVMRRQPSGACGPGERCLALKLPKVDPPCEKRPPDLTGLDRRVAELEQHVDGGRLGSPALAPFEVVNEAGIRVFYLSEQGAPALASTEIFNDTGARVAVIAANQAGGAVTVESGSRAPLSSSGVSASTVSATIRAVGTQTGVILYRNLDRRLDLGRRESGSYNLSVFGPRETLVAGIGESPARSGVALIADASGKEKAALLESSSAGMLAIWNAEKQQVATLSGAGFGDSGLLQLRNNAGTVMVEAGVIDTGIGVVRAGPGAFQHAIGFLGLPASYIEGRR